MVELMEATLKRSHPPKKCSAKVKEFRWWSGELASLHHLLHTAQNKMRRNPTPAHHAKMVEHRRNFKREVRRAKRQSWQQFCDEAANPKAVSLFTSLARGAEKHTLGLLQGVDGTMLETPEETLTSLVDTHFPGNTTNLPPVSSNQYCAVT